MYRHLKSILSSGETTNRVNSIAWFLTIKIRSSNGQKFAIASADRIVQLFDDLGEKKDKFPTKPGDPKVRFTIGKHY
jgi:intraflagellar transport protein 172